MFYTISPQVIESFSLILKHSPRDRLHIVTFFGRSTVEAFPNFSRQHKGETWKSPHQTCSLLFNNATEQKQTKHSSWKYSAVGTGLNSEVVIPGVGRLTDLIPSPCLCWFSTEENQEKIPVVCQPGSTWPFSFLPRIFPNCDSLTRTSISQ